jgi:drug/metabolite transporter (DMT)-like permease
VSLQPAPEIAFALLSLGFLGVSDFLYKWGQRWELRGAPFMLLQNLAYLPTAFALTYIRGELYWTVPLLLGLLNGALAFAAFLFVLLAMRSGEAVVLTPIVRLNFTVTAALAISLLGEQLTSTKAAALMLAALAVLAAGGWRAGGERRGFWLALAAMCLFGMIGWFYKLAIDYGAPPAGMTLFQSIGVFCIAVPFALQQRERLPRSGVPLWLPLVCGVLTSCSYVAFAVAMTHGEAIVVAPIAQLSFVLTGVLAVLILKERLTVRKAASVVMAVVSVLLFANAQG